MRDPVVSYNAESRNLSSDFSLTHLFCSIKSLMTPLTTARAKDMKANADMAGGGGAAAGSQSSASSDLGRRIIGASERVDLLSKVKIT